MSYSPQIINLFLRISTMLSKSLLVFMIGAVLTNREIGEWGIISSTLTFLVLLVGLDVFFVSNHNIVGKSFADIKAEIIHQLAIYICAYLIVMPFFWALYYFKITPPSLTILLYVLLIFEHQSQEICRILNILDKQLISSVLLFLRYGFWVWIWFLFYVITGLGASLIVIIYCWIFAALLSTLFGYYFLRKKFKLIINSDQILKEILNIDRIRSSLKQSACFFYATLMVTFFFTVDKYLYGKYSSPEEFSLYVLYMTISLGVINFLDPLIFSFYLPKLIKAFKSDYIDGRESLVRRFMLLALIGSLLCCFFSFFLIAVYVKKVNRFNFSDNIDLLILVSLISFIYSINTASQLILYARMQSKVIFESIIFAIPVSILVFFAINFLNLLSSKLIIPTVLLSLTTTILIFRLRHLFINSGSSSDRC
jgi:O-antigen/teichoic acid export membrane protein